MPGTWSASIEWLVDGLAARFPDLRFVEVRYRVKSWKRLDWCVEDALAAIESAAAERVLLVGFSMGGAVSVRAASHPSVAGVLGLAPWLPDELDVSPLVGRRLDVLHGALDRWLPGIPGVSPSISRRGFERATRLGVEGTYTADPRRGARHRARSGSAASLPRAARWKELGSTSHASATLPGSAIGGTGWRPTAPDPPSDDVPVRAPGRCARSTGRHAITDQPSAHEGVHAVEAARRQIVAADPDEEPAGVAEIEREIVVVRDLEQQHPLVRGARLLLVRRRPRTARRRGRHRATTSSASSSIPSA